MTVGRRFLANISSFVLVLGSLVFVGPSASATTYTIDCSVDPASFESANPPTFVQSPWDDLQYVWFVEYSGLAAEDITVEIQNCPNTYSSSADGEWWSESSKNVSIGINEWLDARGYGFPWEAKYKILFYNYSYAPAFSSDVVYEGETFTLATNSPVYQYSMLFLDGEPIGDGIAGEIDGEEFNWSAFAGDVEVVLTYRVFDCEVYYDVHCLDFESMPEYNFASAFMGETVITIAPAGAVAPVDAQPQPVPYAGPVVTNDPETSQSGSTVTYRGSDLDEVTSATIAGQSASIVSKSASALTLRVPAGLTQGMHDVVLSYGTTESITLQNGLVVQDLMKVWTQLQSDNTVKMYAKNIIGVGKIQFYQDGKEIAWVRATDALNPKLANANGSSYLVRTRQTHSGKNRFEIKLDGVRIWRATYVPVI